LEDRILCKRRVLKFFSYEYTLQNYVYENVDRIHLNQGKGRMAKYCEKGNGPSDFVKCV